MVILHFRFVSEPSFLFRMLIFQAQEVQHWELVKAAFANLFLMGMKKVKSRHMLTQWGGANLRQYFKFLSLPPSAFWPSTYKLNGTAHNQMGTSTRDILNGTSINGKEEDPSHCLVCPPFWSLAVVVTYDEAKSYFRLTRIHHIIIDFGFILEG